MEIKNVLILEIAKNERKFSFSVPVGAPYKDAYDAAVEAVNMITELAKSAEAKQKEEAEKQAEVLDATLTDTRN